MVSPIFKEELNQPTTKPAFETRQIATEQQPPTGQLVHYPGEIDEFGDHSAIATVEKMAAIVELLLKSGDAQPSVPVGDKLLLTIEEVQLLTGLSKEFIQRRDRFQRLLRSIATGELKSKIIGKSWRVKRADLDEFIDKLF